MNKKGYTLMELLVVIVIIGLILLFVYPAINEMINKNNTEMYTQYENMMVEYAKASSTKATISRQNIYLKLSSLEGLEQVKKDCKGYVHLKYVTNKPNEYKAYISCNNGYKTTGYNASYE